MMPSKKVQGYLDQLDHLMNFDGLMWWLIDIENDEDHFYCNQTMAKVFSLDESLPKHSVSQTCPIAGDYLKNVQLKSSHHAKQIFEEYRQFLNQEIDEYCNQFPYFNSTLDKTLFFRSRSRILEKNENGVALLFGIIEDISELEAQRANLEQQKLKFKALSEKDTITSLYNRRYFMLFFKDVLNQIQQEGGNLAILMMDTDNFKDFNDFYGHLRGDECLKLIAESIQLTFNRETDLVARFGGDEFVVLMRDVNEKDIERATEQLKYEISQLKHRHLLSSDAPDISLSMGAYLTEPKQDIVDMFGLIRKADQNLYKAKSLGKNCCVISTDEP